LDPNIETILSSPTTMETVENNQPLRKRQRTVADDTGSSSYDSNTIKSSKFWFEDGSVVLQAEKTHFRVHKTLLSLHSTVFRDTFQMPQPVEAGPTIEGCPIVHVSDFAEDVEFMLESLYKLDTLLNLWIVTEYQWIYRRTRLEKSSSFSFVSALLRLGKKYDIKYQYEEALGYLQTKFPSDLDKFLELKEESSVIGKPGLLYDYINLALETDTPSILPTAFLLCQREMACSFFHKY